MRANHFLLDQKKSRTGVPRSRQRRPCCLADQRRLAEFLAAPRLGQSATRAGGLAMPGGPIPGFTFALAVIGKEITLG